MSLVASLVLTPAFGNWLLLLEDLVAPALLCRLAFFPFHLLCLLCLESLPLWSPQEPNRL